jgi:arylsulfatase
MNTRRGVLPLASLSAILAVGLLLGLPGTVTAEDSFDRSQLPIPDPPFKGKIGLTPAESVKDFPKQVTAPKGAPNVLLILTDDVGFGASSNFGGPIPTPTMDRIANAGLRYNNFDTTALCSLKEGRSIYKAES